VIVDFEYRNKGRGNYIKTQIKTDTIDTFALSKDDEEIYEHIKSRIFRQINKNEKEVNIEIKNIKIEGQYGETNY
jgi:hypothetical protein|tara:strand:+ start:2100 stop:2324 length:225 start_codon:yes stop_codon:yes gene_type:complete